MKAESGPYWGKLLKAPGKPPHFVKADWSKYKDEDDEEAEMGARAAADGADALWARRAAGSDFIRWLLAIRNIRSLFAHIARPVTCIADHGFDMSQLDDLTARRVA